MMKFNPLRLFKLSRMRRLRCQSNREIKDYEQSVLALLGTMVIVWAGIERMLDELIASYQQNFTDLSIKHPKPLSSKTKYIERHMETDERFPEGTGSYVRGSSSSRMIGMRSLTVSCEGPKVA